MHSISYNLKKKTKEGTEKRKNKKMILVTTSMVTGTLVESSLGCFRYNQHQRPYILTEIYSQNSISIPRILVDKKTKAIVSNRAKALFFVVLQLSSRFVLFCF